MSDLPASTFLPAPTVGRTFTATRAVRLGDVDQAAELRLDSIARYLQDVATDDALDAGLANAMGWLVRRTMIRVDVPATLNERVTLTTFCTGSGRSWAERRTTIRGAAGASIDGVSLWVQIDESGRPARLDDEFDRIYGAAAGGRVVSSKLSLPKAPDGAQDAEPWSFRTTDIDPFGHVNNAAQWAMMEDLLRRCDRARRGTGAVEFLGPSDADGFLVIDETAQGFWFGDKDRLTTIGRWTP